MVDTILKIGDWFQEKVKTKSGIFVLGTFIGAVPASTVSYLLYQDGKYKDERLVKEIDRIKIIEEEKDEWQERAFNAETTCLSKIKEMASFFQDLEGVYKNEELQNRKSIDNEKMKIEQYKAITNKLNSIKNDLKDEK